MNRRKGIMSLLAIIAGSYTAKAQEVKNLGTTTSSNSLMGTEWKQSIILTLDNFTDNAIQVHFGNETIKITREEIITALRPEKK